MKIYIFLYLLLFVIINRKLFSKIKKDFLQYSKLKGVKSPIIETLLSENQNKRSIRTLLVEQFKS